MTEEIKFEKEEVSTALEIPEKITTEFLEQALAAGKIKTKEQEFFISEFSEEKKQEMFDDFGFPEPGKDGITYFYHGTTLVDMSSIASQGLLSIPNNVNVSATVESQVKAGSKRDSSQDGIICVFRVPWKEVEIEGTGFPEAVGWARQKYKGDRSKLPIKFQKQLDLRVLKPEYLIGFFVIRNNS